MSNHNLTLAAKAAGIFSARKALYMISLGKDSE